MPSPMIHLLVAYETNPKAQDLFWVGNFAPDYINDRQLKDELHFRNSSNRLEALRQFKSKINIANPFEAGWLLHLFVDACWDETMIPAFQKKYNIPDWFVKYRGETALASFYLYHHMDWAPKVWTQILKADLSSIPTTLPITQYDVELYRDRLYKRHSESKADSVSLEYDEELLLNFSQTTSCKYKKWIES